METDHVPHAYPEGKHEDQPYTDALLHQRSIKVHRPTLLIDGRRWHLDLGPFDHKVSQYLRLDGCSWGIRDTLTHQLEHPFHGSSHGILVLDDLTEGEGHHDCHRM